MLYVNSSQKTGQKTHKPLKVLCLEFKGIVECGTASCVDVSKACHLSKPTFPHLHKGLQRGLAD